MHYSGLFGMLRLLLSLSVVFSAIGGSSMSAAAASIGRSNSISSKSHCPRQCMTDIVTEILDSMVAHNPYTLPMASFYVATENSHPAALGMMTLWRTVTKAGPPSLLAIDTKKGSAYFALDISEGNDITESVLRGRVKVVNRQITELELFINRYRGDHGFSFSAAELPTNYEVLMSPPANRTKASRASLIALSEALFATSSNLSVSVADSCQFTEAGWKVIDPGTNGNGSTTPLGCSWPDDHPTDTNARVGLVVDEELGFVVTSGVIPGKVFGYGNISAFIPNSMTSAQEAQEEWLEEMKVLDIMPLLTPTGATGDTLEVLQYYNDELQAMQINVYLSGPNMTSPWL
ncbi:uncharacterized protein N7443_007241 [Penicillium atrosanguineum]|uniref:Uncharacterized protein n=1 Tax=Penicillium atrosanguineum TaxID=1132637 RepID=A0A9W9PL81_9EURO|nr:uncharacterized protein N7443_007241 [Penicillium atrosanguineum]KAJ5118312.1 hypothetical protein N7526_009949 [Penicillium atrosanguineum]KAJ5296348.1 hypothetical protein N7443_007241 [Penicillium atrosanguineum]KAJ5299116.1 hypothetical protein N7476_010673 [Penicillium atrosanguineum]